MEMIIKNNVRSFIKELPEETVKVSDTESIKVDNQKVILTEMEGVLYVGFTANVHKRIFEISEDKTRMSVKGESEAYGDYVSMPLSSTLGEIVEAINKIVDDISVKLFGEAE